MEKTKEMLVTFFNKHKEVAGTSPIGGYTVTSGLAVKLLCYLAQDKDYFSLQSLQLWQVASGWDECAGFSLSLTFAVIPSGAVDVIGTTLRAGCRLHAQ